MSEWIKWDGREDNLTVSSGDIVELETRAGETFHEQVGEYYWRRYAGLMPEPRDIIRYRVISKQNTGQAATPHPLQHAFDQVILQVTKGKGVRHGGDSIPFLEQKWKRLADLHGPGFLTGQAHKNLEEAMGKEDSDAMKRAIIETIAWLGMWVLWTDENAGK